MSEKFKAEELPRLIDSEVPASEIPVEENLDEAVIEFCTEFDPDKATIFPLGLSERIEELKDKGFAEAQNLQELCAIIAVRKTTEANQEDFSAKKMISIIRRVEKDELDINCVTRTDDLREIVRKLIEAK